MFGFRLFSRFVSNMEFRRDKMFGFHYYAPTRVVFGKGAEGKAGELAASAHCKKVLLHYGSGSVIDSAKAIGYGVANDCLLYTSPSPRDA